MEVELTGFLVDRRRSTTCTCNDLDRRIGGHPGDMGLESQVVHMVPRLVLHAFADNPADAPVIDAFEAHNAACGFGT